MSNEIIESVYTLVPTSGNKKKDNSYKYFVDTLIKLVNIKLEKEELPQITSDAKLDYDSEPSKGSVRQKAALLSYLMEGRSI